MMLQIVWMMMLMVVDQYPSLLLLLLDILLPFLGPLHLPWFCWHL